MGFGLGLYVDIRPLLLCYSHRYPFDTTTGTFAESVLIALKVFFLGHPEEYMSPVLAILVAIFFLLALTGRLGLIKWITGGVVAGCDLFFSDLRGICAV